MSGRSGRSGVWAVVVVIALAVVVWLMRTSPSPQDQYDLNDSSDSGYRGLDLVMRAHGGSFRVVAADDVEAADPADTPMIFVVQPGTLPTSFQRDLRRYVADGGVLVLGTPVVSGPLSQVKDSDWLDSEWNPTRPPQECSVTWLQDLGSIAGGYTVAGTIDTPAGARSCFGRRRDAWVAEEPIGAGRLITLATPEFFTVDSLRPHTEPTDEPKRGMRDNVVLAVRLFGQADGAPVSLLPEGPRGGSSDSEIGSLWDLLPVGVQLALGQLLLAVVWIAWWKGRRLGAVIHEPTPVEIPASELIVAVGGLMGDRRDPADAAERLRRRARRRLSNRVGVPNWAGPAALADAVVAQTGRDEVEVRQALADYDVQSDGELVAVANELAQLREEVLDG